MMEMVMQTVKTGAIKGCTEVQLAKSNRFVILLWMPSNSQPICSLLPVIMGFLLTAQLFRTHKSGILKKSSS